MKNLRSLILVFFSITLLSSCGGTWTREAYVLHKTEFEFKGQVWPAIDDTFSKGTGISFYVYVDPTKKVGLNSFRHIGPYKVRVYVDAPPEAYDFVLFERIAYAIGDDDDEYDLLEKPVKKPMIYAFHDVPTLIDLDYQNSAVIYLIVEFSLIDSSGTVSERRAGVRRYNAEILQGDVSYSIYPSQ